MLIGPKVNCPYCRGTVIPYVERDLPLEKSLDPIFSEAPDKVLCPHCSSAFSTRVGVFSSLRKDDPLMEDIRKNGGLILP